MTSQYTSTIKVKPNQLPVCCPSSLQSWSEHPKVMIPLSEKSTKASCPYCTQKFELTRE